MNEKTHAGPWRNPRFVANDGAARIGTALTLGRGLRARATAGFALGTFVIEMPVPATLTALSLAGFDFVVLDMEHSALDFSQLQLLIASAQSAGLATLVRPWGEDTGLVGKILDMGANGIMAPRVESPERARAIVEQARFAPLGNRGFSPLSALDALREPLLELGDSTYLVLQIEGRGGVERAAEIAAVPGIDAIFVGPYDLALSMGVAPGSPEVFQAAERLVDAVPRHVSLGIYVDDPQQCGSWAARRFAVQCVSFDGRMLSGGARAVAATARASMAAKP
jgi:2-keto-3-deoxy-L-rhamnonate aldolase RhmA